MITIGADPGEKGGIAVVDCLRTRVLEAFPMPVIEVTIGGKKRHRLDRTTLLDACRRLKETYQPLSTDSIIAMVEKVGPRPMEGGVGAFSFGGIYEGLCVAFLASGFRLEEERPNVWKSKMKVPADKAAAVARADAMFPDGRHMWRGPRGAKLDGPAEAALIAKYCGDLWLPQLAGRAAA
jgi:hypothetical protein